MKPENVSPEPEAIIVVHYTIMDGTVVRWYRDLKDYEVAEPVLSASRNGWMTHGRRGAPRAPDGWRQAAREAHAILKEDRNADVTHLATHKASGTRRSLLIPIRREEKE